MFAGLQKKWKVSGWKLFFVLLTFALAGSATGYLGKLIMNLLLIENAGLYIFIYILVITFLWPLLVILISLPFGQFVFFRNYIGRMVSRLSGKRIAPAMVVSKNDPGSSYLQSVQNSTAVQQQPSPSASPAQLAIFASGSGTNARKIIDYFGTTLQGSASKAATVKLVVSNRAAAGVVNIASEHRLPVIILEKEKFFADAYVKELKEQDISYIILAGFLWKIPSNLIAAFPNRIINIHPALLPNYGGKGMYGHHVHDAVLKAGDKETGITIHYVDELYDHGEHIFQEKVIVEKNDTPQSLAKKVQALEHLHFPRVIEEVISGNFSSRH